MSLRTSFIRRSAIALLVGIALTLPAAVQGADSRASNAGNALVQIDNFARVNANYYRGAQPIGDDYATLASLGVKTVINLASDDADTSEEALTRSAGMSYVQIPMTTHTSPTTRQLSEFLSIVNDPAKQPVYVHCVGGRHRTGVMTAVYRMAQDHWTADQTFKEMKQFDFGPDFLHREFKQFVYGYHPQLAETRSVSPVMAAATITPASPR